MIPNGFFLVPRLRDPSSAQVVRPYWMAWECKLTTTAGIVIQLKPAPYS